MPIPYQIVRSNRKTVAIEIKPDGHVIVRCPRYMAEDVVIAFVQSRGDWIKRHLCKLNQQSVVKLTPEQREELREQTRLLVTQRVAYFAEVLGVTYGRITIRTQHTLWGSCSSKGNLNFNCLLALVPPDVLDYVVVHEVCHRKEFNHSHRFWQELGRVIPDYAQRKAWLKENGTKLIARL